MPRAPPPWSGWPRRGSGASSSSPPRPIPKATDTPRGLKSGEAAGKTREGLRGRPAIAPPAAALADNVENGAMAEAGAAAVENARADAAAALSLSAAARRMAAWMLPSPSLPRPTEPAAARPSSYIVTKDREGTWVKTRHGRIEGSRQGWHQREGRERGGGEGGARTIVIAAAATSPATTPPSARVSASIMRPPGRSPSAVAARADSATDAGAADPDADAGRRCWPSTQCSSTSPSPSSSPSS